MHIPTLSFRLSPKRSLLVQPKPYIPFVVYTLNPINPINPINTINPINPVNPEPETVNPKPLKTPLKRKSLRKRAWHIQPRSSLILGHGKVNSWRFWGVCLKNLHATILCMRPKTCMVDCLNHEALGTKRTLQLGSYALCYYNSFLRCASHLNPARVHVVPKVGACKQAVLESRPRAVKPLQTQSKPQFSASFPFSCGIT